MAQDPDRIKAFFEKDYLPDYSLASVSAEHKQSNALDYSAYHMGQINKKLGRLIELLENRGEA